MTKIYQGKTKDVFSLENGNVLFDEIASGNMRVYKDGKIVEPVELTKIILSNCK